MVGVRFRSRISTNMPRPMTKSKKFDVDRLKREEVQERYVTVLKEKLNPQVDAQDSIDKEWEHIKESIRTAAEEVVGYKRTPKKNDWYDEEYREGIDRRNMLRKPGSTN